MSSARTRFVLGGGGAMGAYQAGMVLALLEAGVRPDALYGCSAGSLNAAFLASDPGVARARQLVAWWADPAAQQVLAPTWRSRMRGLPAVLMGGGRGVLDDRPLRSLVAANVPAHDISELAIPVTVTTTCLDCGVARHHRGGKVEDVLVASCALPGLFAPVRLAGGHWHVDGGVVSGVPLRAALADSGPDDAVVVLDCGLDPVTSLAGRCAARPGSHHACGLPRRGGLPSYSVPVQRSRGPLDVVLQSFTVARSMANRASVGDLVDDPRVTVLPHVADAWAAGYLAELPSGPRDVRRAVELSVAGRSATAAWLSQAGAGLSRQVSRTS